MLIITPEELLRKSFNELQALRCYYLHLIQQAKSELDGEFAYTTYIRIEQRINELVDQSSVESIGNTLWR